MSASLSIPAAFNDPAFRARRRLNWILLGLLYAFFYMTRYNYTAINAQLAALLGWRNAEIGLFETAMPLAYGLSVFMNGPLADRIGGRRAFLFGAAGVVVANLAFGATLLLVNAPAVWEAGPTPDKMPVLVRAAQIGSLSNGQLLWLMTGVWAVNGYFQSFGALAIVKVNAQWFHLGERGAFSGIFGVLIRLGLILAFSGVPFLVGKKVGLPLQCAFWLPGACVAVMLVLNWRFMHNAPPDAGLDPIETGDEAAADDGKPARLGDVLRKVLASRTAWIIAIGSMMIGMVRRSVVDAWYPKYFIETFHVAKEQISSYWPYQLSVWGMALLGIAGGFAFGLSSDRIYRGRRAPVITYGFVGMMLFLGCLAGAFRLRGQLGPMASVGSLMLLSFCVNGAHGMIGGAASMDFGGRKAAATAAGLFDGMQYLAGAVVGRTLGVMLDRWGWGIWPLAPIPFAAIGAIAMATLWNAMPKGRSAH